MSETNSEETNPVQQLVSALLWIKTNAFRRIYFVAYTAPLKWHSGGMSISHAEIDTAGTFGANLETIAKTLASDNPEFDTDCVSITGVQRTGYKIFGKKLYTW